MARLNKYDDDDFTQGKLRSNPREEFLTLAYIDGRNAASGARRVPSCYDCDPEAAVQYQNGFDDVASGLGNSNE